MDCNNKDNILEQSVDKVGLSVRLVNCLHREEVYKLRDLLRVTKEDMMGWRNFGKKCLEELAAFCNVYGIPFLGTHYDRLITIKTNLERFNQGTEQLLRYYQKMDGKRERLFELGKKIEEEIDSLKVSGQKQEKL